MNRDQRDIVVVSLLRLSWVAGICVVGVLLLVAVEAFGGRGMDAEDLLDVALMPLFWGPLVISVGARVLGLYVRAGESDE